MKSARKPARQIAPKFRPGEWAVVLIDGQPIRAKARRLYERARTDLAKAKAELDRFQSEDRPAYEKWLNANFGQMLTELRDLEHRLAEARELIIDVEAEFIFGNHRSVLSAYKEVMYRREHPDSDVTESDPEDGTASGGSAEPEDEGNDASFEFDPREFSQQQRRTGREAAPGTDAERLKQLYRQLARRLHPDKSAQVTPRQLELWHQTQSAYEAGNTEQLETILTLVDIEEHGAKNASVSILTRLTADLRRTFRALKVELSKAKRELAWNFSRLSSFDLIFERTRSKLISDRDGLRSLVAACELQIDQWKKRAESARSRSRRQRRPSAAWQEEELF